VGWRSDLAVTDASCARILATLGRTATAAHVDDALDALRVYLGEVAPKARRSSSEKSSARFEAIRSEIADLLDALASLSLAEREKLADSWRTKAFDTVPQVAELTLGDLTNALNRLDAAATLRPGRAQHVAERVLVGELGRVWHGATGKLPAASRTDRTPGPFHRFVLACVDALPAWARPGAMYRAVARGCAAYRHDHPRG
jgi:hypothetical protein